MSDQEKIYDLEARVLALELIAKQCLAALIQQNSDSTDDGYEATAGVMFAERLFSRLQSMEFGTQDPNVSMHLEATARDHVVRVVRELLAEMENELSRQ